MTVPSTFQMFRALAWLRWRVLINTITRSGARDVLERLSRAAESLLPVAVIVLLIPAAVAALALGGLVGARLPVDAASANLGLQIVRWLLVFIMVLALLGPMILSSGAELPGMVRLMLLPIPTRVLYISHALSGLTDPWIFLMIPLLVGVAGGALWSGAWMMAASSAFAGFAFLLLLLGLAAISSAALQLMVRNRRRAELLVLVGMMFIVVISLLPSAVLDATTERHGRARSIAIPSWIVQVASATPSELYVNATRNAAEGGAGSATRRTAGLLAWALVMHGLTWPIYQRLLRTPASSGGARRVSARSVTPKTLPLVGARTSAVAIAYLRLALRTPRGRSTVLMPILMTVIFGVMLSARGAALPLGPVHVGTGFPLGIFGIVLSLMSVTPFAFNQFAVDRAGLTLQLLAPISNRELLYGKAIGAALIASIPCALAVVAGAVTGGHRVVYWIAIVLGALASYVVVAPIAAVLSLLFPRAVDLSSIGSASNPHQAAALLGVLAFAVSCVPPVLLGLVGLRLLHSPAAAAGLLGVWVSITCALAYVGFLLADRLLDARKENLAFVASGR